MPVIDFDAMIKVRVKSDLIARMHQKINNNQELYSSMSHYVRCCIIKDLEGEKK